MSELANVISTLGFPIACCLICFYFINKIIDDNREDNIKRDEKFTAELTNITNTLNKICDNMVELNKRLTNLEDLEEGRH